MTAYVGTYLAGAYLAVALVALGFFLWFSGFLIGRAFEAVRQEQARKRRDRIRDAIERAGLPVWPGDD